MKEINLWDIWSSNFYNAKRFFESKGNGKTKSRLKNKWFREFVKEIEAACCGDYYEEKGE